MKSRGFGEEENPFAIDSKGENKRQGNEKMDSKSKGWICTKNRRKDQRHNHRGIPLRTKVELKFRGILC